VKLHLGCGAKRIEDAVNVDMFPGPAVDLIHDLRTPLPVPDGTVDEIYACHLVEHFTRAEWLFVLPTWAALLAPGGRIILECPDAAKVCEAYAYDKVPGRDFWKVNILGDDGPGMAHRQLFTLGRLRDDLEAVGLTVEVARAWRGDGIPDEAPPINLRVEAVKA
jgi:predicted SAM-dependent methyltransferase